LKYALRHVTSYDYAEPVDLGSHLLHLTPRALRYQHVSSSRVIAAPRPARTSRRTDHFGNDTSLLFLELPHDTFTLILEAQVEVTRPAPVGDTSAWEAVRDAVDWTVAEFVMASPRAVADAACVEYVAASFPPGRPIAEALRELIRRIYTEFEFRGGVTGIMTPVSKVMAMRAGVCQDFSHLMIAGLRALGIPARYVSGYLRTKPPPGTTARLGADQSHAWVAAWLGPAHGWIDLDPTNDLVVADEHVTLGWGRDFSDVSPVRGMILGGGEHTVSVAVDLSVIGEVP